MQRSQKLETAQFSKAPCGLVWIETTDKDMLASGEFTQEYATWLLSDTATDRVLATIDEPYPDKLCYSAALDNGQQRRFLSLQGAQRWAVSVALEILNGERANRALNRKCRRVERVHQ